MSMVSFWRMDIKNIPFDATRMAYGGFKVLVDL
jgi:uncharacterized protein YbaA (DUF1428 family)